MSLFQTGDFTLASGAKSKWKIECDALTTEDWAGLAAMAAEMVRPFDRVVGVPRGGLPFAEAMCPYASPLIAGHTLVVDDVLTSGGSITKVAAVELQRNGGVFTSVFGLVVFARGSCPSWVTPLFQCPKELWVVKPLRCSVCRAWSDRFQPEMLTQWTADGFMRRSFKCGHPTVHCLKCFATHYGCATCGVTEELT